MVASLKPMTLIRYKIHVPTVDQAWRQVWHQAGGPYERRVSNQLCNPVSDRVKGAIQHQLYLLAHLLY